MESETSLTLQNIKVIYGITLVSELVDAGYSIDKDFVFHEDSQTVMCGLFKENEYLGDLVSYRATEMPSFADLQSKPVDLILLDSNRFLPKTEKMELGQHGEKATKRKLGFSAKLVLTFVIHALAFGLFALIYSKPAIVSFLQKTAFEGPLSGIIIFGMIAIVLPIILIAFLWAPFGVRDPFTNPAPKGFLLKKLGYAFWVLLNAAFSIAYIIAAYYYFADISH